MCKERSKPRLKRRAQPKTENRPNWNSHCDSHTIISQPCDATDVSCTLLYALNKGLKQALAIYTLVGLCLRGPPGQYLDLPVEPRDALLGHAPRSPVMLPTAFTHDVCLTTRARAA